jgi:hypothetical protein
MYTLGPTLAVVQDRSGNPQGMAFSIGNNSMVTCAHVVIEAIGHDPTDNAGPDETQGIPLYFFQTGNSRAVFGATVKLWHRPVEPNESVSAYVRRRADIALLELAQGDIDRLRSEEFGLVLSPAVLLEEDALRSGPEFEVYGNGAVSMYKLSSIEAEYPIAVHRDGKPIVGGFSGGAAMVPGGVLGMVVRATKSSNDPHPQAKVIPSPVLRDVLAPVVALRAAPTSAARHAGQLEREHLWILKDREPAIETARAALALQPGRRIMPVLIANFDAIEDCSDGFVRRLEYELGRDAGLSAQLETMSLPPPANLSGLSKQLKDHEREALRMIGPNSKLKDAAASYHGAYISSVDFADHESASFAIEAAKRWGASCAGLSGPGTPKLHFFLLLMTDALCPHLEFEDFVRRLEREAGDAVSVVALPEFSKVRPMDLPRWAYFAASHLRPPQDKARLAAAAKKFVYAQRTEMTMGDWYEGLQYHEKSVFEGR